MSQDGLFGARPLVRPADLPPDLERLAARHPTLRMGTSSWTFPGWRGHVWRDAVRKETLTSDGLPAYAQHPLLRTVSIDSTYYRVPVPGKLARYASQVPADFRFVVKTPSVFVNGLQDGRPHPTGLDPEAVRRTFVPRLEELGDRLGAVLLQIPPQAPDAFGDRFFHRLASVLSLPLPWVVEVRTPAWFNPNLAAVLEDTGAQPCLSVHPRMPSLRDQWRLLRFQHTEALHIRWNLGWGQDYGTSKASFAPFDRLAAPDLDTRGQLAKAIAWALRRERPVWVVANNKAEGCAPATLEALARAIP